MLAVHKISYNEMIIIYRLIIPHFFNRILSKAGELLIKILSDSIMRGFVHPVKMSDGSCRTIEVLFHPSFHFQATRLWKCHCHKTCLSVTKHHVSPFEKATHVDAWIFQVFFGRSISSSDHFA